MIQDQLSEIASPPSWRPVRGGAFIIDRWIARDFQSFVSYNSGGNDPDGGLYSAFITDGGTNAFQFQRRGGRPPAGERTHDHRHRGAQSIYQNVEVALAEEAPVIFICTRVGYFALRASVRGFQPSPAQTWSTLSKTSVAGEGRRPPGARVGRMACPRGGGVPLSVRLRAP